jgi:hypothetical protein
MIGGAAADNLSGCYRSSSVVSQTECVVALLSVVEPLIPKIILAQVRFGIIKTYAALGAYLLITTTWGLLTNY